jgi:glutamate transport system permease protein
VTTALYDQPGPRAIARNQIFGVVSGVAVLALIAWIVYRFYNTGQFDAIKWQQFEYKAVQRELLDGYLTTLKVAGIASVGALVFGALLAGARLSDHRLVRGPAVFVVELFRAIPLLVLIFFAYYVPLQYGFRAGMLAVPSGQSEAGYAIGLRKSQVMTLILLPQAVRAMLPAIVSQLVVLLKDTALGFIINYPELLFVGKQIGGRLTFGLPYVPTYLIVAAIYIATCGLLSLFAYWLQRRLIRGKRPRTAATPMPITMEPGSIGPTGSSVG